jgi:hypothetical protein
VYNADALYADGHLYFVSRLQNSTVTLNSINGIHVKYPANGAKLGVLAL